MSNVTFMGLQHSFGLKGKIYIFYSTNVNFNERIRIIELIAIFVNMIYDFWLFYRTEVTQLYYEVTAGGVRQDCPHTPDQITRFNQQVSENIGAAVQDNHRAPLVVSSAMQDEIVEYTSLFTTELTESLDPQTLQEVLPVIADAWDEKYPGTYKIILTTKNSPVNQMQDRCSYLWTQNEIIPFLFVTTNEPWFFVIFLILDQAPFMAEIALQFPSVDPEGYAHNKSFVVSYELFCYFPKTINVRFT